MRRVFLSTRTDMMGNDPPFRGYGAAGEWRMTSSTSLGMTMEQSSSFLSLVNDQLVTVGIAKLRHPTHRRLEFLQIELNTALFEFRDDSVNVIHFERDRGSVSRRLPRRMTTNSDGSRTEIVLDPRYFHFSVGW